MALIDDSSEDRGNRSFVERVRRLEGVSVAIVETMLLTILLIVYIVLYVSQGLSISEMQISVYRLIFIAIIMIPQVIFTVKAWKYRGNNRSKLSPKFMVKFPSLPIMFGFVTYLWLRQKSGISSISHSI